MTDPFRLGGLFGQTTYYGNTHMQTGDARNYYTQNSFLHRNAAQNAASFGAQNVWRSTTFAQSAPESHRRPQRKCAYCAGSNYTKGRCDGCGAPS
jgi:hypothetical protein